MAFKIRCEFWKLSRGDTIPSAILDETVADAIEIDSETIVPVELPELREAYAMSVYCLSGAATVESMPEPTMDPLRGRLVVEGSTHWFLIKQGEKLFVAEYVV